MDRQVTRKPPRVRALAGLATALIAACGGAAITTGTPDASSMDADSGENACGPMIPDAAVYSCEALPAGSAGCRASPLDPNAASDPHVYPEGCGVTLPVQSTYCGPVGCTCMAVPGDGDAGLHFICPL